MSEGLLWLCDTENFIDELVYAAQRFQEKHGRRPNICRMRGSAILRAERGIKVIYDETILPGHFLLAYEQEIENET